MKKLYLLMSSIVKNNPNPNPIVKEACLQGTKLIRCAIPSLSDGMTGQDNKVIRTSKINQKNNHEMEGTHNNEKIFPKMQHIWLEMFLFGNIELDVISVYNVPYMAIEILAKLIECSNWLLIWYMIILSDNLVIKQSFRQPYISSVQ